MTGGRPVVVEGKVGRGVGFIVAIWVLYKMTMVTMPAMAETVRTTKAAAKALVTEELLDMVVCPEGACQEEMSPMSPSA